MLTDDALRSYTVNTHHLLQLLSLTTIFEFDGLSNCIPAFSCHLGSRELQITLLMLWQPRSVVDVKCLVHGIKAFSLFNDHRVVFFLQKIAAARHCGHF